MDADHIDQTLASGPAIDELRALAQARSSTPRLQVLTLAAALAQAALPDGDVPDSDVLDAARSTLAAAKAADQTAH